MKRKCFCTQTRWGSQGASLCTGECTWLYVHKWSHVIVRAWVKSSWWNYVHDEVVMHGWMHVIVRAWVIACACTCMGEVLPNTGCSECINDCSHWLKHTVTECVLMMVQGWAVSPQSKHIGCVLWWWLTTGCWVVTPGECDEEARWHGDE